MALLSLTPSTQHRGIGYGLPPRTPNLKQAWHSWLWVLGVRGRGLGSQSQASLQASAGVVGRESPRE